MPDTTNGTAGPAYPFLERGTGAGFPFCPHADSYREVHPTSARPIAVENDEVTLRGGSVTAVASFELVRGLLGKVESELFPGVPQMSQFDLFRSSAAEHASIRAVLNPYFSRRNIERYRVALTGIVNDQIALLREAGTSADLVNSFSAPVSGRSIACLVGAPEEMHAAFARTASAMFDPKQSEREMLESRKILESFIGDCHRLVAQKREQPGDDLLSYLIDKHGGEFSDYDLAWLCTVLLAAGYDTTANMISWGAYVLLTQPEASNELRADPDLWENAIEELMRFVSFSTMTLQRSVLVDTPIAGFTFQGGDDYLGLPFMANWDASVFPDPHMFDIHRSNARSHLGFSHGPHHCLGQNFARMEMRESLSALLTQLPQLALTEHEPHIRRKNTIFLESLNVRW
ncbi:cytochrome P450 [Plantibacter sp. YIM 135249]|uniref:cytochrome P450 n=1 Tax=Plantibacter sp. YIM 135249 TaxID=3423918 RepID=UPI003D343B6B